MSPGAHRQQGIATACPIDYNQVNPVFWRWKAVAFEEPARALFFAVPDHRLINMMCTEIAAFQSFQFRR